MEVSNNKKEKLAGDVPIFNYYTIVTSFVGFTAACISNMFVRKPIYSGVLFKHVPNMVIGGLLGYQIGKLSDWMYAEREFRQNDFKARHPELFVKEPAKKAMEVQTPFKPIY